MPKVDLFAAGVFQLSAHHPCVPHLDSATCTWMRKKDVYAASRDQVESAAQKPGTWAEGMLAKFGWSKGKGLGKQEDGLVSHIRVSKKDDTLALGFKKEELSKGNDQWFLGLSSGDPFAKASVGGKAAVTKGQDDSDSDDSSEGGGEKKSKKRKRKEAAKAAAKEAAGAAGVSTAEGSGEGAFPGAPQGMDVQDFYQKLFDSTGGARLGMRARRDQPGKWDRAEAAMAGKGGSEGGGVKEEGGGRKEVEVEDEAALAKAAKKERKRAKKEKKERKARGEKEEEEEEE